ncbi:MAG: Omp28-related outer membrane protein [Bacteroidia bacterium]
MKKIYLFLVVALMSFSAMAQTFVSTSPEKKNAVLEEFTGIYCTFCPDGHKRAQELKDANKGDVVLINIHQGGYANPNAGDPDFRTPWGDAIAGQSGLSGYPAGTVNRHKFAASQDGGTAQSRGDWANSASTMMSENSPVNVAIQTELDMANRELTIDVEVYYTADAANAKNKLNVAILQNNVPGPQTGATSYYPENILANGDYNHQHMLRDLVTGQWGEDIDATSGSFFSKTYTYSIPADINGVPVLLHNLEVAAFVAENQQEILSGVSEIVDIPAEFQADLSVANNTVLDGGICATSVTPSFTVTNLDSKDITSFDIIAMVGTTEYKESYSGTLAQNESTEITFDEIALPGGTYSISVGAPENLNGGTLLDTKTDNSAGEIITGYSFMADAITTGYEATFNGTNPESAALVSTENSAFRVYYSTQSPYGAKASYGALQYYLHSSWNVAGKPADFVFGKADLSKTSDPYVSYWYAYSDGSQGGTAPTIELEVSDDCGTTWNGVHTENARETGQPTDATQLYLPSYKEYRRMYASLEDYKDKEVIIRLRVTPGSSGNSFWIDEINLISDATSIDEADAMNFSVYPNPVTDNANVSFEINEEKNIEINIYDALGRVVSTVNNTTYNTGNHNLNIAANNLENGLYIIKVESNGETLVSETLVKE